MRRGACAGASASRPMPSAAQRDRERRRARVMRSRRNIQLPSATTAGIDAMITPADTALVRLTPNSMQIENRKLPRKDSRNTRPRVRARHRGLVGRAAQPVRHRQRRDAEAQPGQQQHREGAPPAAWKARRSCRPATCSGRGSRRRRGGGVRGGRCSIDWTACEDSIR